MTSQWYISDPHFHHENIIDFCKRPFRDVREMDEYMIHQWNKRVKPSDHVTCLGDLTMERGSKGSKQAKSLIRLIKHLNGHKRLLLGNHDHFPIQVYLECGFEKIYATHRNEHNWLLSHIPVHPSSIGGRCLANVHGHIHQNDSPDPAIFKPYETVWNVDTSSARGRIQPYVNISVEKTGYGPISVDEINARIRWAVENWEAKQNG